MLLGRMSLRKTPLQQCEGRASTQDALNVKCAIAVYKLEPPRPSASFRRDISNLGVVLYKVERLGSIDLGVFRRRTGPI